MTDFLLLAFIFLVAGVVAVPVAARLGLGSVLGYLIAGIVISPVLTLLHVDVIAIQQFAEFGVVMMLFLVGLELEPKLLWAMRAKLVGLGGGQVGITTIAIMGFGLLFGLQWSVALAVGLVLALSSTAIVLQTLNEKGLLRSDGGRSSFSVLLFQDIAVIPMLALLPLLALPELQQVQSHAGQSGADTHGGGMSLVAGMNGWQAALITLGAIGTVIVVGSRLTSPLLRYIAAANLRELFVATALMIVVGIALLMSLVGLSPALGTFLAGVVLANSEYRHELESDIDPFKGLLLGLFFMTVGAGINFLLLYENALLTLGLTIGLIATKASVLAILAFVFKIKGSGRWLFALGLSQAGEFGFVLLSLTVSSGVIPTALADQLLLVVALSMLLTPALFIVFERWAAPRFSHQPTRDMDEMPKDSKIIVAGHGRMGSLITRILRGAGYTPTEIDFSGDQIEMLSKFGMRSYYGDVTRPALLESAGIGDADLFIVTIDGKDQITALVRYVASHYPDLHIVARAVDRNHYYDLWHAGCHDIIREIYDGSLRMGRSALEALGAQPANAHAAVAAFDTIDQEIMMAAASHYDPALPAAENDAYVRHILEHREERGSRLISEMAAALNATPSDSEPD